MKIPKKIQSALYSYDLKSLDLKRDKKLIITQILNHGSWEQVQWLLDQYTYGNIEESLKSPLKGEWMPDVINYWEKILDFKLSKKTKEKALFSLKPK